MELLIRLVAGTLAVLATLPSLAFAQAASSVVIDGPPPPTAPATMVRDAEGRVTVRAVRLEAPLQFDGVLSEPVYQQIPPMSDFVQQEPAEGAPATERTDAWVFFDDRNVYVAARCWDSQPERIVANEMRRDNFNIFQNDNFTVVLDTFYSRRAGVFFQTNPLGGLRDQEVTDERTNNTDWNTVWDVRATQDDQGWTLELVIPFKSLRYARSGPQVWGINMRRVVRAKNEQSFLSFVPASYSFRGIYKFSSAATLVGIETPSGSNAFEIKPYALGTVTTNLAVTDPYTNNVSGDAGFDVKYGLTKGLVTDFTYRTDFSQVEEDQQQVNLTRFSLFFPEKREFFLEGQGLFLFGNEQAGGGGRGGSGGGGGATGAASGARSNVANLTPLVFFSRRIGLDNGIEVPIEVGGRLTGRAGKYTVGALNIQTDDSDEANARSTNFSVVRLRRDVLRRSAIGVIGTYRTPGASTTGSNGVFGADVAFAFFQDLRVNGYWARSWTEGTATAKNESYRAQTEFAGDRYGFQYEHLYVGDGFDPQVGFLRREAFRRNYAQVRFSPRLTDSPIRKLNYEAGLDHITDTSGRLETREVQGIFRAEFNNNDQLAVEYSDNYEFLEQSFTIGDEAIIPPGSYSFGDVRILYEMGPQRRAAGTFTLGRGGFYGGDKTQFGYRGYVELRPDLSLEPGLDFNWIDLPQTSLVTRLVSVRTNWTVTPRMLVSALLQYNSSNDTASGSVRFRWEYQPGSDLFVVYSEGRNTDVGGPPRLSNRTFAIKMTRLLRF